MGFKPPILAIAIVTSLLVLPVYVRGQCTDQQGCLCYDGFVTCSGLTSFPTTYPDDTKTISISNTVADEIPPNVFMHLPILENIEIYSSNITVIPRGAFDGVAYAEYISFNEIRVDRIESGAFSNITDIGTLVIYISTIDTIETDAFSNIFALDALNLFMLNITTIESNAFNNIEDAFEINFYSNNVTTMQANVFNNISLTGDFNMYLNYFDSLGCRSVVSAIQSAESATFYSNTVPCSCQMSWVLDDPVVSQHMFSNWCVFPDDRPQLEWEVMTRDQLGCDVDEQSACAYVNGTGSTTVASSTASTSGSPSPTETVTLPTTEGVTNSEPATDFTSTTEKRMTTVMDVTESSVLTTDTVTSRKTSTTTRPSSTIRESTTDSIETSTSTSSTASAGSTSSSVVTSSTKTVVTSSPTQSAFDSRTTAVPTTASKVKPTGENLQHESSTITIDVKSPSAPTDSPMSSSKFTEAHLVNTDKTSTGPKSTTENIRSVKHSTSDKDETNAGCRVSRQDSVFLTMTLVGVCNILTRFYFSV